MVGRIGPGGPFWQLYFLSSFILCIFQPQEHRKPTRECFLFFFFFNKITLNPHPHATCKQNARQILPSSRANSDERPHRRWHPLKQPHRVVYLFFDLSSNLHFPNQNLGFLVFLIQLISCFHFFFKPMLWFVHVLWWFLWIGDFHFLLWWFLDGVGGDLWWVIIFFKLGMFVPNPNMHISYVGGNETCFC